MQLLSRFPRCISPHVIFLNCLFLLIAKSVDTVGKDNKFFALTVAAALNNPHKTNTGRVQLVPYRRGTPLPFVSAARHLLSAADGKLRTDDRIENVPAAKTNISKSTTAFLKIFIKIPPVNLSPSR